MFKLMPFVMIIVCGSMLPACTPRDDYENLTPEEHAILERRKAAYYKRKAEEEAYLKKYGHPKFNQSRYYPNMAPMVKPPENSTP